MKDGQTIIGDHNVRKFEVTIRSLSGVGVNDLKDQLQKKWEVVAIELKDSAFYGRPGAPDFPGD